MPSADACAKRLADMALRLAADDVKLRRQREESVAKQQRAAQRMRRAQERIETLRGRRRAL